MEKEVIARKEHICDECNGVILPKQKYILYKARVPRYREMSEHDANCFDDEMYDEQIGIEFYSSKSCINCVEKREAVIKEVEEYVQTKEYKYWASMQEHRYP